MKLPPLPKMPEFSGFPPVSQWPKQRLVALGLAAAALLVTIPCAASLAAPQGLATPESAADPTALPVMSVQTVETAATPTASPTAAALPLAAVDATVLPLTADAGRSYVDETLFIGDSNTARYMMYADETGTPFTTIANNIGVVSMGAESITTLKCEQFSGYKTMYTIPDAVAMLKPRRILIGFGTNNLKGYSTDATSFISTYLKGLKAIEEAWPSCDIIVNAIPPLDYQRENTNLTMAQVDAYNAALTVMCEENGYYFLNSAEVLRDENTGWAKKDYTLSDGVHLSKTAVTALFEYLRTHALLTEDTRPQPLGTLPTPIGPPVNLINNDPIAVRGQAAKVPVEFVATNGGYLTGYTSQLVAKGGTAGGVTAVANSGFSFAGWTASMGSGSSSSTIYYKVPTTANAGGVVLTAHFTANEHEHIYVKVEGSETAATCLTPGVAKYKCSVCGALIEKEVAALGHSWDKGVMVGNKIVYTCTREDCGATKEEVLSATATPFPSASPLPSASPSPSPKPTATALPTTAPTSLPPTAPPVTPSPTNPPPTAPPVTTPLPTAPPATAPPPTAPPLPTDPPPTAPPPEEVLPTEAPPAPPEPTAVPVPDPVPEPPTVEQPTPDKEEPAPVQEELPAETLPEA